MSDLVALSLSIVAVGLFYGADPARSPHRGRLSAARWWRPGLRLAAAACVVAALWLYAAAHGWVMGSVAATAAFTAAASAFVLVAPFAPRAIWSVPAAAACTIVAALAIAGARGLHGF